MSLGGTGPDIEGIELPLLIEAVYRRWGYDFRDYSPASLRRRICRAVQLEAVSSISALQERLLRDEACMVRFLEQVTVSVTMMFRDPNFYRVFREKIIPILSRKSVLRIWHAGCASGEEAYSMAIVLHEEGLLNKSRIFATDINPTSLQRAKQGIYPLQKAKDYSTNYQAAGGKAEFAEYFRAGHGHIMMRSDLSERIVWAQHSLVSDSSFHEFDLILCRNVMIYFNKTLQERAHGLLLQSLAEDGLLVLGRQESIAQTPVETNYQTMDFKEKIFRRVV